MSTPLRVLILEDRQSDAELMIHELRRAGFEPAWRVVGDEAGYLAHLDPAPDVILADYTLPHFDAERALQLLQARQLDTPFIVVTGSISEEVAVACMKQGAADYLLKDRLARLGPAVKQALEQYELRQEKRQAEAALRRSEQRYRQLVESSPNGIAVHSQGKFVFINSAGARLLGAAGPDELVGRPMLDFVHPDYRALVHERIGRVLRNGTPAPTMEEKLIRLDGVVIDVEVTATAVTYQGQPAVQVVLHDITERKGAEQARQRYAQRLETLLDISRAILAAETLLEIADVALHRLLGLIPCRLARLGLLDLVQQQARIITGRLDGETLWLTETHLRLSDLDLQDLGPVLEPLRQGEAYEVEDLEALAPGPRLYQPLRAQGLRSFLALPLIAADELVGTLGLGRAEPGRFAAEEVEVAREIANLLAIAIRQAQLLETERAYRRQLHDLTEYLHTAREEERTAIAREIHDELGQALTALKIDLAWIARRLPQEKGALTAKAKEMSAMLDSSVGMVQRIATELRPGVLDDLGLMAALEWQVRDCARRTGLACQLQLPEEDLALDRHLATALFRIVQETLTNVTRHAAAKRIWVTLASRPEELRLVIRDDGRGISEAQIRAPTSLGLIGMRERVRPWNGAVTFEGVPGQGTTVTVRIPETRRRGGSHD